ARLDLVLIRIGLYLALAGDFDTQPQLATLPPLDVPQQVESDTGQAARLPEIEPPAEPPAESSAVPLLPVDLPPPEPVP
ncbi:MAG: hypothetical protein KDA87_24720, partial [Planctomycetales bacterium]|nr:hypothetical protein [Planctomycetales bacterium]